MRMPREGVDAAQIIKDWLKVEMAEHFPQCSVRLELSEWKLGDPPTLVVFAEPDLTGMWPVATAPTIRLTSWTSGRDVSIINRAMGLLLTSQVPGVAKILPGTGVIESRDSTTRGDLASCTVLTRIRTQTF